MSRFTEYQVVGRRLPTEAEESPKLYRMRIFAPDEVVAKSRFWYYLRSLRKIKKANGEIVSVNVVSATLSSCSLQRTKIHLWGDRFRRKSPPRLRTLVSGCDTTPVRGPTTCTRRSGICRVRRRLRPSTRTWLPGIVLGSDRSRWAALSDLMHEWILIAIAIRRFSVCRRLKRLLISAVPTSSSSSPPSSASPSPTASTRFAQSSSRTAPPPSDRRVGRVNHEWWWKEEKRGGSGSSFVYAVMRATGPFAMYIHNDYAHLMVPCLQFLKCPE